ncbi:male-enhanced antigen 1 [Notolabrus celidotus]|uniref:male-enhanced antigen 1 n=1 Tax=Notolabrus celidotus TaxID=1203425 RepID=UPI0014907533|nr:male-enhanced antigen 1 [Notolabrus celidotus]
MEVCSSAMGPERVLPNSEDELGEDERPADGVLLPVWSGGEAGDEEEEEEGGGEMVLDGDGEEEEEEVNNGGYYYQPLNQEPDGVQSSEQLGEEGEERGEEEAAASHTEQLQQVQQRIEVMGLHLPEAPSADSEDEEDADGAAAQRSRASIPMDADHVELVKRTMAAIALPSLGVPSWAREISDDQWTDMVQTTLQTRQSATALRLPRKNNLNGP